MDEYVPNYVQPELGKIDINPQVVSMISAKACLEVPGVVSMSGGLMADLTEWFGSNLSKGVTVNLNQTEVSVSLKVILRYGVKLHEVARQIQENVRYAIEDMTDLRVMKVDVTVVDVELGTRG